MTKRKKYREGSIRTTSFDVAALAGVSQSAVSRAFKPGASIAPETRDKILDAARKLNYVPNSIASSLTTHRSNIVALILGDLHNPFYTHVLEAFGREMQDRDRQLLVFTVNEDLATDDAIMRLLRYQIDGVILTSAQLSTQMVGMCHNRGIPVVLFNRYIPQSGAFGVRCDNSWGGRQIAEAFLRAGAKTFGMITGDPNGTTSKDRVSGFVERLIENGVPRTAIRSFEGNSTYEGACDAVRRMHADADGLPDAIFGINDTMAMGAMDTLRHHLGLSVPGDVMIAGFDDIPEGARLPYQLTTVRQPIKRMVRATIEHLNLDNPGQPIDLTHDQPIRGHMVWRKTVPGDAPPEV
ncbi:substrate-binding domain-containing protein [Puniceibacterium sediminis]|uniref:DNA-binding transcriptional regulator, LacI/PurR family n=1 Tax=Puniceibacterium sediminis TaxID=1608407 RepID=A0A238X464_9RHOB|nr:substrate-binding domain-containing protein [Puniceibacterium sediminis]SNR53490.1 DNA-binding transcriptional regulator, LacI/PurR family [Puniceibacterium sediminis]